MGFKTEEWGTGIHRGSCPLLCSGISGLNSGHALRYQQYLFFLTRVCCAQGTGTTVPLPV